MPNKRCPLLCYTIECLRVLQPSGRNTASERRGDRRLDCCTLPPVAGTVGAGRESKTTPTRSPEHRTREARRLPAGLPLPPPVAGTVRAGRMSATTPQVAGTPHRPAWRSPAGLPRQAERQQDGAHARCSPRLTLVSAAKSPRGSPGWTPAPQNHAQRTVCCAALKLRPRYDTGTARTLTAGSQGSPKK